MHAPVRISSIPISSISCRVYAWHVLGERLWVPQARLLLDTSRLGACERLWFETRRARRNGDFIHLVENWERTQQPNVSIFGVYTCKEEMN